MESTKHNKILSIQSHLAYSYVGNNIATAVFQMHGIDSIMLPTVLLASHTGYQPVYGTTISPELFEDLAQGLKAFGIFTDVHYAISGYFGSKEVIDIAANLIQELKQQGICYICDPVMGDLSEGKGDLYIPKPLADHLIAKLLPLGDIFTPNHFELEYILGTPAKTADTILSAIKSHPILSQKIVIVTSAILEDTPTDNIEVLMVKDGCLERFKTKKMDLEIVGTGDLFASFIASQMALGNSIEGSIKLTVEFIHEVLKNHPDKSSSDMSAQTLLNAAKALIYK